MKLSEIMQRVCGTGDLDFEVSCVTADSRQVVKDSVFICIRGQKFDGHDHAKEAVEAVRLLQNMTSVWNAKS